MGLDYCIQTLDSHHDLHLIEHGDVVRFQFSEYRAHPHEPYHLAAFYCPGERSHTFTFLKPHPTLPNNYFEITSEAYSLDVIGGFVTADLAFSARELITPENDEHEQIVEFLKGVGLDKVD